MCSIKVLAQWSYTDAIDTGEDSPVGGRRGRIFLEAVLGPNVPVE